MAILDALDFIETRAAAGDIGFFDVYAEDAAIMLQDRWSDADRATAETFYRSILTSMPEVFRDNSREIHEIVVAGDWAFVRVTFRRPPTQSADGELVRDGSRHIMIWRRQLDGGWKLQSGHLHQSSARAIASASNVDPLIAAIAPIAVAGGSRASLAVGRLIAQQNRETLDGGAHTSIPSS